jgi:O-antigen ligase
MLEWLVPFFIALPYVMAFSVAVLLCLAAVATYRYAEAGAACIVLVFLLGSIYPGSLNLGMTVLPPDVVLPLLAVVFAVRFLNGHYPVRDPIGLSWLVLGVVWFLLFALGIAQRGSIAGVAFRSSFYIWVTVAYLLSFKLTPASMQRCVSALIFGGLVLSLVVISRWVMMATGNVDADDGWWRESISSMRVVSSFGAQYIALCLVVGLAISLGLSRPAAAWAGLALVALPLVVVLQHRTVWIASLVTLAVGVVIATRSKRGSLLGSLVPLMLLGAMLGALLVFAPESRVSASLGSSVEEAGGSHSTFSWRVESWQHLVGQWAGSGPIGWLSGQPFGTDMVRFMEQQGAKTSVSAHSQYVGVLFNGGLLGLLAYVAAQGIALKRLWPGAVRRRAADESLELVSDGMLVLFIVSCLTYAITYGADYAQALVLGLAYSRAVQIRAANASPIAVPPPAVSAQPRQVTRSPAALQ